MRSILSLSLLLLTLLPINRISAQIVFRLGSDSTDYGKDITIDLSGNVIVAGYFYGTADFDPGSYVHNLTSNGYIDNFVAKYSPGGMYRWAINYGGSGADSPNSLKTDSIGNIYVCGYYSSETDFNPDTGIASRTNNGGKDVYIAKYDSNGNFMWANTFGATNDDEAFDLRLNRAGDVYVTGVFQNTIDVDPGPGTANLTSHGGNDIFLVKYTSDGNYLWGFNVGGTGDDEGTAVAVDTLGDCYLSGYFSSTVDFDPGAGVANLVSSGNVDVFIAKYLSDGNIQWVDMMGGKGSDQTSFGGIAISLQKDIYITGGFSSVLKIGEGIATLTSNGSTDVFVIKYSSDGVFRFAFSFGGKGQDRGQKINIDDYSNIYVAGWFKDTVDFDHGSGQHIVYSQGTNGASDIFIVKYLPNTDFSWVDAFGAATSNPNDLSVASAIALNNQNDLFVTGRFYKNADFDPGDGTLNLISAGVSDIFVAKYSGNGLLWGSANYPIISVTPKNLNFGSVIVDSTRKSHFTVFNSGGEDLVISSITSSNPKFSIASWYSTILPEQAQEFTVSFTPADSGIHTGWIVLNHNALNKKDSISVRGSGVGFVARESLSISIGWNMVSLPLIMGSSDKSILFPTAKSDAFAYNGTTYFIVDSLQNGIGYWMKFDSAQTVRLTGQSLVEDTIWVTAGWNLIGSLSFPVETSSIIQEPSANVSSGYFEYFNSYVEATILVPGKGYWVKVSNEGKLILVAP